ncbi:MAG: M23 family metallopeptidase [Dysgonomonas sp.]
MQNHYKRFFLIIYLCITSIALSSQTSRKEELTRDIIKKAVRFEDIEDIVDIIKRQPGLYKHIPSIHPIAGKNNPKISSFFGTRFHPVDKVYRYHTGIDFTAEFATTIHVTATGKVIYAGIKGGYGKCVIVQHTMGFKTLYAHMTECYTEKGKIVNKGDIIGFLGSTGKSTGAHLHYEILKNGIPINPYNFLSID